MKRATTILIFCVAALLALGTVMLFSSPKGASLLSKQLLWCLLGLVACVVATVFNYQHLKKMAWPLLIVAGVMLALVIVPQIGTWRGGARRWFNFGLVLFQPSEFAKLALIIAVAWYGDRFQRQMSSFKYGMAGPAAFLVPLLGLIILEPDYGTTLLLAAVCAIMLLVAGARFLHITLITVVGLVAVSVLIWLNPNRMSRLVEFINGTDYQSVQAMIALGSGGWNGLGLGDGRQKLGYVPENHTDFILSIIGEELGLVATLGVVLVFVMIVICGIYIASNARDRFGFLLAVGLTFLIGLQAFINIGVVSSALPNKGLPLPFVSYGGSSLVMMLAALGLLLNVARHGEVPVRVGGRRVNPFNPSNIPSTQLP